VESRNVKCTPRNCIPNRQTPNALLPVHSQPPNPKHVAFHRWPAGPTFYAEAQVSLVTMHASKGLEFKVVFCVGMEEGTFPHRRTFATTPPPPDPLDTASRPQESTSSDTWQQDDERRLAFVALTRARDLLYLSHRRVLTGPSLPSTGGAHGGEMRAAVSRYVTNIPSALLVRVGWSGAPLLTGAVMRRVVMVLTRAGAESRAVALLRSHGGGGQGVGGGVTCGGDGERAVEDWGDVITWDGLHQLAMGGNGTGSGRGAATEDGSEHGAGMDLMSPKPLTAGSDLMAAGVNMFVGLVCPT
jgi:hypothetical protein